MYSQVSFFSRSASGLGWAGEEVSSQRRCEAGALGGTSANVAAVDAKGAQVGEEEWKALVAKAFTSSVQTCSPSAHGSRAYASRPRCK